MCALGSVYTLPNEQANGHVRKRGMDTGKLDICRAPRGLQVLGAKSYADISIDGRGPQSPNLCRLASKRGPGPGRLALGGFPGIDPSPGASLGRAPYLGWDGCWVDIWPELLPYSWRAEMDPRARATGPGDPHSASGCIQGGTLYVTLSAFVA